MATEPAKVTDSLDQLVQRLGAGASALFDKLRGAEAERDRVRSEFEAHLAEDRKAKTALVDIIGRIESLLVLALFAGTILLALNYAPVQEGRQMAGSGFTLSLA